MKNNLLNCFIILLASICIFVSSYSIYQTSQGNIDFNSKFEQDRMEQQKEYWQDRALITFVKEWPKFTVEFNNKTGQLTTESGGDGNVTIMGNHPNVTIDCPILKYIDNQTWHCYMPSGGCFVVTLSYPDNISFNITVVKDIERFHNPFTEDENWWWDFPDKKVVFEVRTWQ